MFIIEGIITGLIATIIYDFYQLSQSYAYNINRTKWNLIGRYFVGFISKKVFIEDIENEIEINNELLIGYLIHYTVGLIFGIFYVLINKLFFHEPSIILALTIGFITVLGSWCFLMPYAFNIGFFANQKEEWKQILVQNLISHFIFGISLYLGYYII